MKALLKEIVIPEYVKNMLRNPIKMFIPKLVVKEQILNLFFQGSKSES